MVEYLPLIIALVISVGFVAYMMNTNVENNDSKPKDTTQIVILFCISFVIVYMISNLIIDSSDNKNVMNHIKLGEPPF